MKKKFLLLVLLLSTIISACTIQKRYHRSGYHFEWKKKYRSAGDKDHALNESQENKQYLYQEDVVNEERTSQFPELSDVTTSSYTTENEKTSESISATKLSSGVSQKLLKQTANEISADSQLPITTTNSLTDAPTLSAKKNERNNGDHLLYSSAILMALGTFLGLRAGRKKLRKLTRWASKNSKQAQVLIAAIQIPLMGMSVYGGYNLYQMGYNLSDYTMLAAATGLGFGVSVIPFLPKNGEFILQKRLNRRRAAFLGGMLASSLMLVNYGNNLGHESNLSYAKSAVSYVDNILVGNDSEQISSNFSSAEEHNHTIAMENSSNSTKRQAANFGLCVAAILLFVILITAFCAGICMVVFGLAGAAGAVGNLGLVVGGIGIAVGSLLGMTAIARQGWCRG